MSDAKVTFLDENWDEGGAPGTEIFFNFACPLHKGRRCEGLAIRGREQIGGAARAGHATWEWDGNREAPTFSPSVDHTTCWHGFIKDGRCVKTDQTTDEPEPMS